MWSLTLTTGGVGLRTSYLLPITKIMSTFESKLARLYVFLDLLPILSIGNIGAKGGASLLSLLRDF